MIFFVLVVPGSSVKNLVCHAGDPGSIPGWGSSLGEGNGNLLHTLAWEIQRAEKPDGLQSMGGKRLCD